MTRALVDPVQYARERVARLGRWWDGPFGAAVKIWGPAIWPGVPPTALLGLAASSEGAAQTGAEPDYATGLYGVERARLEDLAVAASNLLGRHVDARVARDAYLDDLEAQAVTGLLNYRNHHEALFAKIPAALWQTLSPCAWELRATVAAYSAGPGRVAPVLRELAPEIAACLPEDRWSYAARRVADWPSERIAGVSVAGKWRVAHWHLRAEQRLMCGLALELRDGGRAADWFEPWVDRPEHRATVDRLLYLANKGVS